MSVRLSSLMVQFFWVVAGFVLICGTANHSTLQKKRYHIEDSSKIYLKGTSNVNAFTCDCEERYNEQILEAESNGGYARFKNAQIQVRSKNFNCHNRKIDADMQKALQVDKYPYIKVALADTWQNAKCLKGECKDWFDVQANVNITITKTTKFETVAAKAKVIGPNQVLLKGEKALQLSAYGITPPEAMFGMIKVNDWVTFYFDLVVRIDDVK